MNRPICQMPRCMVQITPEANFCAGHIYLNAVERRRADDFVKESRKVLIRAMLRYQETVQHA